MCLAEESNNILMWIYLVIMKLRYSGATASNFYEKQGKFETTES